MAIKVSELKGWLANFNDDEFIAIDEDGLTLVLIDGDLCRRVYFEVNREMARYNSRVAKGLGFKSKGLF